MRAVRSCTVMPYAVLQLGMNFDDDETFDVHNVSGVRTAAAGTNDDGDDGNGEHDEYGGEAFDELSGQFGAEAASTTAAPSYHAAAAAASSRPQSQPAIAAVGPPPVGASAHTPGSSVRAASRSIGAAVASTYKIVLLRTIAIARKIKETTAIHNSKL